MATLIYNDINLPFVNITRFEQTAMYDEMGTTDWYVNKFDITATSVINTNYMVISLGGVQNVTNPAAIMRLIYSLLMKPRKELSITFNGVELIPQAQRGLPGMVDAKNGPKPHSCNIIRLTDTTFLIVYRIVAHYWENNSVNESVPGGITNEVGNNVLYNRWTEQVDIDGKNFSTRVRDGVFAIRSDNASGFIADQVRNQMAVVGIPKFFLRENAQYAVSADGLTLRYQIRDKEVFKNPPTPAFTADGSWTLSAPALGNPVSQVTCQVRLEGDSNTNQDILIARGIQICFQKILSLAAGKVNSIIPTLCTIRAGFYSNWVDIHWAARLSVVNQAVLVAAGSVGMIVAQVSTPTVSNIIKTDGNALSFTPFSDIDNSSGAGNKNQGSTDYLPPYQLRGTANLLLQAAAYYDPNGVNTNLRTRFIAPPTNTTFELGNAVVLSTGVLPGQAGTKLEP